MVTHFHPSPLDAKSRIQVLGYLPNGDLLVNKSGDDDFVYQFDAGRNVITGPFCSRQAWLSRYQAQYGNLDTD